MAKDRIDGPIRTKATEYNSNLEETRAQVTEDNAAQVVIFLNKYKSAFEAEFNEFIDDLEAEGIQYSTSLVDPQNVNRGACIVFQKSTKVFVMPFTLQGPKGGNAWKYDTKDEWGQHDKDQFAAILVEKILDAQPVTVDTPEGYKVTTLNGATTLGYMKADSPEDAYNKIVAGQLYTEFLLEGYTPPKQ